MKLTDEECSSRLNFYRLISRAHEIDFFSRSSVNNWSTFTFEGMMEDVHPVGVEVTSARLLEMIESAYPNPLSITEMAKYELK